MSVTAIQGCTCGLCRPDADAYGNVDYGQAWSTEAETYVPRDCPVAREATRLEKSIRSLVLDGFFRRV